MGNQEMVPEANEAEDHYKVIAYKGSELPPEYKNLIKAPFLNSLRCNNDLFKLMDPDNFYSVYGKYIEQVLLKKSLVRMAALSDKTILGWCLTEGEILHYVWVKKEVRRQGIGKSLVPPSVKAFSHITTFGLNIWGKDKYEHLRFTPFV